MVIVCKHCKSIVIDKSNDDYSIFYCPKCDLLYAECEIEDNTEVLNMVKKDENSLELDFSEVEEYVPTGIYDLEIIEISQGKAANENETPYLRLKTKIINNERYNGRFVYHSYWLTKDAMGILRNALVIFGYPEEKVVGKTFSLDKESLIGKRFQAQVENDGTFCSIKRIKPIKTP